MNTQTILLIDDDSDMLQVIGNRCRHLGLNVEHARNLLTATTVIDKIVPDVVCVDVEMPTGNGLRFCEALSADPRTAHVPIIVLTGRRDTVTIEACRRIGAKYVFKSADIWTSLEPLLRQLLLLTSAAPARRRFVRPRTLPTHNIPPWPAEADAGRKFEAGAGSQSKAESDGARAPTARQVVIADDDADLVRLLSQRLSLLGCSVIGVDNPLSAINAIYRLAPDLVVLDVNMPSGNGLSVCEMMSSDQRLRRTPVIILTGQSDEKTIRRCHDMMVFYVQKGTNVWDRVEPLVRELLHLGDAPGRPDLSPQPTPAAQAAAATDAVSPASDRSDDLLDAVFTMLGTGAGANTATADAPHSADLIDATAYTPVDVKEVPWVLCIDDDPDFSDALKSRLEEHGVAVARAASGMEGYCMAFASPASAILLDYNIPNGRGDYILGRLKNNRVTRDIPVLMITGAKDKMLERRMMSMGAAGYFDKPVRFDALRDHLAKYIDILANRADDDGGNSERAKLGDTASLQRKFTEGSAQKTRAFGGSSIEVRGQRAVGRIRSS